MKINLSKKANRKIRIVEKHKIRWIELNAICYLSCEQSLTHIHLINKDIIVVFKLLKYFENELLEYGFVRANRTTLINLRHLDEVIVTKQKRVILINNQKVKISRRKFYLLKHKIKQYSLVF